MCTGCDVMRHRVISSVPSGRAAVRLLSAGCHRAPAGTVHCSASSFVDLKHCFAVLCCITTVFIHDCFNNERQYVDLHCPSLFIRFIVLTTWFWIVWICCPFTSLQVPASERPSNGPAASICVGIRDPRSMVFHSTFSQSNQQLKKIAVCTVW